VSQSTKTKAEVEALVEEKLNLSKNRRGSGFDINGNGRMDISDAQVNELAQSLGWSPDRLRELLHQGGIDFQELQTLAASGSSDGPDRDFSGLASFAPSGGGLSQGNNAPAQSPVAQLDVPAPKIPPLAAEGSQTVSGHFQTANSHFQTSQLDGLNMPAGGTAPITQGKTAKAGSGAQPTNIIEAILSAIAGILGAFLGFGKSRNKAIKVAKTSGFKRKRR